MKRIVLLVISLTLGAAGLSAQTPQINTGGVVNAANYTATVTPGSLFAIGGSNLANTTASASTLPLPTTLGGTQVLINGVAAPLIFVSPSQVNGQIPWETPAGRTVSVQVIVNGVVSNTVSVSSAAFSPALFSLAFGQGAILIAGTGSVAAPAGAFVGSRPVEIGESISIFAEGLGPVNDQPQNGAAPVGTSSTTLTTPEVTIGGVSAPVSFSGLAPGAAGLYQINARVPSNVFGGSAVPVVVTIGGASSNSVTIAVNGPPPPALADVTVSQFATPNPVSSGGTLSYIVTAQNLGTAAAANVIVRDTFSSTLSFISCASTSGSCSTSFNVVTASLGTIAPGASAVFIITVTVPSATSTTSVTNAAVVSTSSVESNANNNSSSQSVTINPPAASAAPDLVASMTVVPNPVTSGEQMAYIITLVNSGGSAAQDVVVSDSVPALAAGLSCTSTMGSCTISSGQVAKALLGVIPAGSSAVILITATAGSVTSATSVSNQVTVTSSSTESNTNNNQATVSSTINPIPSTLPITGGGGGVTTTSGVDLGVSVSGTPNPVNPGSNVTIGVTVQNFGTADAANVSVTAVLPAGMTFVSCTSSVGSCAATGQNVGAALNTITAGTIQSMQVTATVAASTAINTSLLVTGNATTTSTDVNAANNTGTFTFTTTSTVTVVTPTPNGTAGANVQVIAIDPTTTGATAVIYAGTNGGGVFKSTDGGTTWNPFNTGLTNYIVQGMATIGGAAPVYAATQGGGVFKSTGGGAWATVNFGLSSLDVRALVVDAAGNVYAATNGGGVFKTTSAGASWSPFNSAGLTIRIVLSLALDATNGKLYAGTSGGGIFQSGTTTASWADFNAAGPTTGLVIQALVVDVSTSSVYAGTATGVFKSSTSAASWTAFINPAGNGLTSAFPVLALAADGAGNIYAGTSGGGVFKSATAAANWAANNFGLTNLFVPSLAIDPVAKATIFAGTFGGGVFKSVNAAQTWTANISALTSAFIHVVAVDPTTPAIYAGSDAAGVFKSVNAGVTWTAVNTGLARISGALSVRALAISPSSVATLYAGTAAGVFKTTNGGANWFAASGQGTAGPLPTLDIRSLLVDVSGNVYVGTNGAGVYLSSTGGATWTAFNAGLTGAAVNSMALDSSFLYAATASGGVCRTSIGTASWTCPNTNLTNLTVFGVALDPGIAGTIYAATADGIFKSPDSGGNWTQLFSGVLVSAVVVNPTLNIFAATSVGVYKSTDGGLTWGPQVLPAAAVLALACTPTAGSLTCSGSATLYAASTGGVFQTTTGGAAWANPATTALTAAAVVSQSGGGPDGGNIPAVVPPTTAVLTTLYTGPGFVIQSGTGAAAVMYAATAGGVFKSTNGGGTWAAFNGAGATSLPDVAVRALAVDVTNSNLYAATSTGVFQTATGAASWLPVNFGLTTTDVLSMVVSGTTIFAGTNGGGVFNASLGAGAPTWSPFNGNPVTLLNLVVTQLAQDGAGGNIFAATSSGVFKSPTGFASWAAFTTNLPTLAVQAMAIDVPNTAIYVGTATGVYKSATGTAGFTLFDSSPSSLTQLNVTALAVGGGFVYAGTNGASGGIFRASIAAATGTAVAVWSAVNTGLGNTIVQSLLVDAGTPATVFAGTQGGGVFKSGNATAVLPGTVAWAASNVGMGAGYAAAIAVDPTTTGTAYAGVLGAGVFKTTNLGTTWTAATTQPTDPFVQAVVTVGPAAPRTLLYAGTKTLGVFKSTDAGVTWAQFSAFPAGTPTAAAPISIQALAVDGAGNLWAGSSTTGVLKLTGGVTWSSFNSGLAVLNIQALAVDAAGNVFAGTPSGVFECATCAGGAGTTWTAFSTGLTTLNTLSLAADGAGNIYAGTIGTTGTTATGGVFKSATAASSFTSVSFGLSNLTVQSLAVPAGTPTTVYAGTQGGIFRSTDGGANWSLINTGVSLASTPANAPVPATATTPPTTPSITSLAIDSAPANVYAGSSNGGVFKSANASAATAATAVTWAPTTP